MGMIVSRAQVGRLGLDRRIQICLETRNGIKRTIHAAAAIFLCDLRVKTISLRWVEMMEVIKGFEENFKYLE